MSSQNDQKEDLYLLLAQSKDFNESSLHLVSQILKGEKNQDCIEFLSLDEIHRQVEQKIVQIENSSLLDKEQMLKFGKNDIKKITNFLNKIKDHDFNRENYAADGYKEITQVLIKKISQEKKIIELLKFLVHLTAFDQMYIQCGSNSLYLLIQMKVDLKEQSFEKIRIRNTQLLGADFVRCDLSGSQFDNVIISGINLNQANLSNCKWRNLRINEVMVLNGHTNYVNAVCFSNDGNSLASSGNDNFILLWCVKTGKIKSIFKGQRIVKAVSFSPNDTLLAFGSDKFVYLWNRKIGKQISKLIGHTRDVNTICFSPDSISLASSDNNKCVFLWDVRTRQQKAKLVGHTNIVKSACFSPDGTTLASGSADYSIRLWDFKTEKQKSKLDGHTSFIYSVCFSPDGTILASGSSDDSIGLWDVKTGQMKAKLYGHSSCVNSVCFSPDGTTLASGGNDNSIHLWDVKTGQQKYQFEGHDGAVQSVCFSPGGKILATGSYDKSIRLWDVITGQQILPSENRQQFIRIQCKPYILSNNILPDSATSNFSTLLISQNYNLQAQRALIQNGEFVNYQGVDLKKLFISKGSLVRENEKEWEQN
ncbi:unnamed protein product [Paramecium octaurelia]|uniref:WD-40 repeat protein n=1 Tax=Paramecium octaurelia TaxID=43137 RepID=A0A8S1WGD5_PAROT|nr:unnamed protein product [Paramecium octaurelia]